MIITEMSMFYLNLGGIADSINLRSRKHADGVRLTTTADCLYPYNPMVHVQYSEHV